MIRGFDERVAAPARRAGAGNRIQVTGNREGKKRLDMVSVNRVVTSPHEQAGSLLHNTPHSSRGVLIPCFICD